MNSIISLSNAAIAAQLKATRPVLLNVNLELPPAQVLYIIGRIGSGKSSLLKTIYGATPLMGGRGVVCGINLTGLRDSEIPTLRQRMGIIFQDNMLIAGRTVWENLEFMLRSTKAIKDNKAINARIEEILDIVGMRWAAMRYVSELSGGEAQKVAIARAIMLSPSLIIADEPTGNLDPASAAQIMTLLHNIADGGAAVIIASHNIETVRSSGDDVMMCENGSLNPIELAR